MAILRDIIISYIDEALDIDDLENLGDFVRSVVTVENLADWQLSHELKQLYNDLSEISTHETDLNRRLRLKAALSHFEADFLDYIIAKEIDTISGRNEN